ncbi:hypothetical protein [Actinoplanes sp. NPDC051851]|uniref:hypothetical protein n=1 Tax=Actinoplanes sp. NPDC051851 TaxID=3154753 RepID=UPI003437A97F
MRKLTKRSTAVAAGVAVAVIGGGAAFAAATGWNIGGTGKGTAKAAEIKPLTATSTLTGNIYPGVTLPFTTKFKNTNEFDVVLNGKSSITSAAVTPADAKATSCENGLKGTADILKTDFPGTPEIKAGTEADVSSTVEVGSLPQDCAGKTIKVEYSFEAISKTS